MRVLFVGAGKRLEMALKFLDFGWQVHSYEYDTNCPLNKAAIKIIKGKRWKDPSLMEDLAALIPKYDLVLPFQDEATRILAEIKQHDSAGSTNICVSPLETTKICLDKDLFGQLLSGQKFYPSPLVGSNVIAKPRYGFGSKGIRYISNWDGKDIEGYVLQHNVEGGNEFSLDCYFDRYGSLIDFVPRCRIETAGGEVVKSVTVDKKLLAFEPIVETIAKTARFSGPLCVQVISDSQGNLWIMEINARFGGGSTLSIASGFNMIDLLKTEYVDCKLVENYSSTWHAGIHMSRCFVDYYFNETNSF